MPTASRDGRERRLRAYLTVTLVALWGSALALVVLGLAVGPSRTLLGDVVALAAGGIVALLAAWLARSGRTAASAAVVATATWTVALAITWMSPFLAPVALLCLLLPLVIVADHLPGRLRWAAAGATVVLSGVLVGVGEYRHLTEEGRFEHSTETIVLLGLFVSVTVSVVVAGIVLGRRDDARRLGQRTRELEESRARLAVAAGEARRAIERDLHDGAQQRLTTLAVDLGRATRLCATDPQAAGEVLRGLQGELGAAMRELRDLAHGIYPPLLEQRGLGGALPAAARRTVLPCTVDVRGLGRHTPGVEAAVYFCCTEAIQNADRHSGGSLITVQACDDDGPGRGLRFSVTDDGTGFDPTTPPSTQGLTGMRDRIRAAGGDLRVITAPGRGTTVEGRFPPGTRTGR